MFAPGLSRGILGMADTRLKSGVAIFPQQAEQISPGHPPRPRPLHADPTALGRTRWTPSWWCWRSVTILQPPGRPALQSLSPPPSRGTLAFWACSLLLGGPGHTAQHSHTWGPPSLRDSPGIAHPTLNSCGFCFGLRYCGCFQCEEE